VRTDFAADTGSHSTFFRREIASGEFSVVRITRPAIEQTTWMSFGAHRALSTAAQIVTRQIRKLTLQRRKAHARR
jgi:LysR family transcriptional regulator, nitrogen assimilation regulatory protein